MLSYWCKTHISIYPLDNSDDIILSSSLDFAEYVSTIQNNPYRILERETLAGSLSFIRYLIVTPISQYEPVRKWNVIWGAWQQVRWSSCTVQLNRNWLSADVGEFPTRDNRSSESLLYPDHHCFSSGDCCCRHNCPSAIIVGCSRKWSPRWREFGAIRDLKRFRITGDGRQAECELWVSERYWRLEHVGIQQWKWVCPGRGGDKPKQPIQRIIRWE